MSKELKDEKWESIDELHTLFARALDEIKQLKEDLRTIEDYARVLKLSESELMDKYVNVNIVKETEDTSNSICDTFNRMAKKNKEVFVKLKDKNKLKEDYEFPDDIPFGD